MMSKELEFTLPGLIRAAIATVRDPKVGAQMILRQRFHAQALWPALVAIVAVSVILGQGTLLLLVGPDALGNSLLANPLSVWIVQLAILAASVFLIHFLGQKFKGKGSLEDALALMVWLEFILACVQVIQIVAMLISPVVSDVLGILGLGLFLWLLTNFVAVQHGFNSLGAVFGMIMISLVGLLVVLTLLLPLFGVILPGGLNV